MLQNLVLRFLVLISAAGLLVSCQQGPPLQVPRREEKTGGAQKDLPRETFFYQISKGEKTSYLLGTMHYGISLDEVSAQIRPLLRKTRTHIYEVLYSAKEAQYFSAIPIDPLNLYRSGLYETARAQGRKALARSTAKAVAKLGVPPQITQAMSDADCDLVYYRKFLFSGKSMDLEAQRLTRKFRRRIVVLDTVPLREQAKVIDEDNGLDFSCSIKEKILKRPKALKEMDVYLEQARDDYQQGNTKAFVNATQGVKYRTAAWLKQIRKELEQGSVFISVGADHLHGPGGLLEALEGTGYSLKPLQ